MKLIKILFATTLLILICAVHEGKAQNFFKTEPGMMKMLGDTTFGTAAEVTFLPGQKSKTHTHAAAFIYALTDGALTVHHADGRIETLELKAGMSFIVPAEGPHWSENPGKKALKFILVEFNDHPYKDMMKK